MNQDYTDVCPLLDHPPGDGGNYLQPVQVARNIELVRGLVQSPCGKISVIMTLGGEGVLVHDVMQLRC